MLRFNLHNSCSLVIYYHLHLMDVLRHLNYQQQPLYPQFHGFLLFLSIIHFHREVLNFLKLTNHSHVLEHNFLTLSLQFHFLNYSLLFQLQDLVHVFLLPLLSIIQLLPAMLILIHFPYFLVHMLKVYFIS